MQRKSSGPDGHNRGVSPVVGVVLMVGITVVLAAVIGSLALGFTDGVSEDFEDSADADFVITYNVDSVTVTHAGGDEIPADQLRIDGDVANAPTAWGSEYETVSEGDSRTFNTTADPATVYVVYRTELGEETLLESAEN